METFLVTGANRGIGLEITRQLLESDRQVIATCRDPASADLLNELALNKNLNIFPLEVTHCNSIADLSTQLSGTRIDVLINNAGEMGSQAQSIENMDYDAWLHTFSVNTIAPFHISTALLANLRISNRPRIMSISSQMGSLNRISAGSYAYRSSKAALNKVMQVMANDLQTDGIIVCTVHPGWVKTDMGGSAADISAMESARGLIALADSLSSEHNGRFWNWNGEPHAW